MLINLIFRINGLSDTLSDQRGACNEKITGSENTGAARAKTG